MAFDVLSFVMGQKFGKVSGGSSETVLMESQTVTGFEANASYQGAFTTAIQPRPFAITVGEEYIVEWDGEEYTVTGQDTSSLMTGTVSIGNGTGFGFSGNNEPFFIIDWGSYMTFVAVDTETSHTVKIYQKVESEEPSGGGEVLYESQHIKSMGTTAGTRVSVNFGFMPDMIILYPDSYNTTITKGNHFIWIGFSSSFREKTGYGLSRYGYLHTSQNRFIFETCGYIDRQSDTPYTNGIYNCDETGFNVGSAGNSQCGGDYYVDAWKFT